MPPVKPITIKLLKEYCEIAISKGWGDKTIMISDDDEGNGYHYLWYEFTPAKELADSIDNLDENIAKLNNTIILG